LHRRGLAAGVSIHDQLDAAIALSAFGVVVGGHRLRFTEAVSGHGRSWNALLGEKVTNAIGAAFGGLLVKLVGAGAVCMSFGLKSKARTGEKNAGNLASFSRTKYPAASKCGAASG
jgi:hypothetical protein